MSLANEFVRALRTLALGLLVCLSGWGLEPGYVDPTLCAGCHKGAAEGYARSGMARSFGVVRAGTDAARTPPGRFHHAATEQDFAVSRRNGKLYLSRSRTGYDGRPADVLEKEMDYWIGSGNHARSYLSRGSGGKLVELPLTWYSRGGGRWGMSPGYDISFHAGFSRKINYACLFCHAGYPDLPPGTDQDDAGWKLPDLPGDGVDCQRCHGPGQAHAEAVKSGETAEQVRAAIVNPKKLGAQRGMDVCLQCHLETTTVRLPGFLRKYGRGVFSYRAGEPLEDSILYFDRAADKERNERVEFAGEGYRLRLSACFRESKGALTCMTCHNPHDVRSGEAAKPYYTAICLGCHGAAVAKLTRAGRHTADQDCVACHMPRRNPDDALQTVVSDHFIRGKPPAGKTGIRVEYNDSTTAPYRGEVTLYYPSVPKTPLDELYLAVAQVKQRANPDAGLPHLEALVRRIQPAQGQFYLDLAEAWRDAGDSRKAVEYARQAVERMQGNWRAWYGLGNLLVTAGDLREAEGALKRAEVLAPAEPTVPQTLGETYGRQGKFREALAAFRSALASDPEFADAHNNVGTTLLRLGDRAGAERELREAVRLRPESAVMQVNLAAFLAAGRAGDGMPEARSRFELALKLNPEYAEGYSAYGAALGAVRDWAAARKELEASTRLNPKAPVPHHNLGVVLLELNDQDGAIRQFQAAVALDPNYYEAHLKLALLLTRRGQRAEAEPHLRKAAESPDAQMKQVATGLLARQTANRQP